MRILFSLLDAQAAGGQAVALSVARRLVEQGHEIGVLVPGEGPAVAEFERLGRRVSDADIHTLRNAGQVPKIARALRGFDVLYSHTSIPGEILGDVAARLARVPHVVHRHTPSHLSPNIATATAQRMLYRLLPGRRTVIAVAPHVRRAVISIGARPDRAVIVPNGVDTDRLRPGDHRPQGALRVGLLGRFDPQKGMDVFISAFQESAGSDSVATFVIAGPTGGPFRDFETDVRARAQAAGIEVMDPGADGTGFLSSLDIVVMPSRWEGLPLTLLEAMALGKSIIASDIDGIREVLADAGILVRPEDPQALATALASLLADPTARDRLGEKARERAQRDYSLATCVETAADIVASAVR